MTSDGDLDDLLNDLAGGPSAEESVPAGWQIHLRPHAGAMRNGGEPLLLLRELAALGAVVSECDTTSIPSLDDFDPHQGYLGWTYIVPQNVSEASVKDIFDFVGDDCPIAIGANTSIPPVQIEQASTPPAPVQSAPTPVPAPPPVAAAPLRLRRPQPPRAGPRRPAAGGPRRRRRAPPAAPAPGQSIRIDLIKLDKLIDTVGEW
jgi:two-component system chemotaxis sensor kinase CheA